MKKILLLLLSIPITGISQTKLYQCDCYENEFRQTFEIDISNKTISHYSSIDLSDDQSWESYHGIFDNVIWENDMIYFLWRDHIEFRDIYFYRFNLNENTFISQIFDYEDGSLFEQVYECSWIAKPNFKKY